MCCCCCFVVAGLLIAYCVELSFMFGCLLLLLLFEDYSVCPLSIIVVEIAIAFEVSSERLVEIWVFVVVIVELHIAGCVGKGVFYC